MPKEPKFYLNLLVAFLGTVWIPILNVAGTVDGEVLTRKVPMYLCYRYLFTSPDLWIVSAVLVHLAVVVGGSYAVWRLFRNGAAPIQAPRG
ncbi:MAG: hypothetical protein HYV27_16540 [Candidatus Hydrogenedentes bacterium]|nr:hypothetical protein [Candidatus Hydrogenedentota bacterium]